MSKERLKIISSLINKDERVLDIGTDHGLVPIFLLNNNITSKITATDINQKPLEAARNNLMKHKLDKYVTLVLTDGFKNINPDNYDVIILAGLGGKTICNIISSKKFKGRYIIHSTTSLSLVRNCISKNQMTINNEIIIKDKNIFNIIIEASPGKKELSQKELYLGPSLMSKDINYTKTYYTYLLNNILRNAKKSNNFEVNKKESEWLKEKLWS